MGTKERLPASIVAYPASPGSIFPSEAHLAFPSHSCAGWHSFVAGPEELSLADVKRTMFKRDVGCIDQKSSLNPVLSPVTRLNSASTSVDPLPCICPISTFDREDTSRPGSPSVVCFSHCPQLHGWTGRLSRFCGRCRLPPSMETRRGAFLVCKTCAAVSHTEQTTPFRDESFVYPFESSKCHTAFIASALRTCHLGACTGPGRVQAHLQRLLYCNLTNCARQRS